MVILPLLARVAWKRLRIGTAMWLVTFFLDLLTSMTPNNLEPLKRGFIVNFSQFLDAAHISTLNCDEMAGDRPRQHAYEIISIRRRLGFIFCNFWLRRRFQEWIASKWIKIDQDNLWIGIVKTVERFMSFAQITCIIMEHQNKPCQNYENTPYVPELHTE